MWSLEMWIQRVGNMGLALICTTGTVFTAARAGRPCCVRPATHGGQTGPYSILQRQSKRTTEGAVNARTCVWHAARSGEEKGVGAVAALALAHGSG
jgi:hypothetical protein